MKTGWTVVALLLCSRLALLPVELEWDANPDPAATLFRIYMGSESGVYTNAVDTGTNRHWSVPISGPTFFSLTARYTNGLESDFSAELLVNTNAVPTLTNIVVMRVDTSTNLSNWTTVFISNIVVQPGERFWRTTITK